MLFGKSLFQSVVDRLGEEAKEDVPSEDVAFRVKGLASSFIPMTPASGSTPVDPGTDQRLDAYLFLMPEDREPEPPEPPAPPQPPAWINRLSPEEIAADLGLDPGDDRERLQERRRAFARDNHPDRIAADFREEATMRMKIANRLIDDAISRFATGLGR
ncbi:MULTISPECIES: hypothetical protein [Rhizobiaceae]|uniref:J domain-containing protein n=1 Tax=Peteryoungia algae TaxID=2919917 RepID=A0ABT0CZ35_9HYPH|nr:MULTISPECIES: hypothetical protein [unclassified Rhizobium]MCC8932256.1 hypothetical protein [Rhizobium sp. 'Codium 1']MCJ8238437.1 hypothetical protein [Rhizobium sp. SSM4.3]